MHGSYVILLQFSKKVSNSLIPLGLRRIIGLLFNLLIEMIRFECSNGGLSFVYIYMQQQYCCVQFLHLIIYFIIYFYFQGLISKPKLYSILTKDFKPWILTTKCSVLISNRIYSAILQDELSLPLLCQHTLDSISYAILFELFLNIFYRAMHHYSLGDLFISEIYIHLEDFFYL